jgi:hypothetical protein
VVRGKDKVEQRQTKTKLQAKELRRRNYGINTKRKQDHKHNHVLDRVGRNVMWRAWRACK